MLILKFIQKIVYITRRTQLGGYCSYHENVGRRPWVIQTLSWSVHSAMSNTGYSLYYMMILLTVYAFMNSSADYDITITHNDMY